LIEEISAIVTENSTALEIWIATRNSGQTLIIFSVSGR